jgi:hypothetical protein
VSSRLPTYTRALGQLFCGTGLFAVPPTLSTLTECAPLCPRLVTPPPASAPQASVLDSLARQRYGGLTGVAAEARLTTLHGDLDRAVYHLAHSAQLRCVPSTPHGTTQGKKWIGK